jgi:hypothetical protein
MDGKSIADSILGPIGKPSGASVEVEVEPAEDEESAEDTAIGATADLMLGAIEAKDRKGLVDALRALVTMIRDGG